MAARVDHGAEADLGRLDIGDHLCWSYTDAVGLRRGLTTFTADGLARNHKVMCLLPEEQIAALRDHIAARIPALTEAERDGALMFGSAREAYLPEGTFDADRRLAGFAAAADQAVAEGYGALRVLGEATEVLSDPNIGWRWTSYELRAELLASHRPFLAVCAYDARRCSGEPLGLVRAVHGPASGDWKGVPAFRLGSTPEGGLRVAGELDMASSNAAAEIGRGAAGDAVAPLLDVTDLRFVDVSGMRAIVQMLEAMADRHPVVRVRGASPTFRRLWGLLACERVVAAELERS